MALKLMSHIRRAVEP